LAFIATGCAAEHPCPQTCAFDAATQYAAKTGFLNVDVQGPMDVSDFIETTGGGGDAELAHQLGQRTFWVVHMDPSGEHFGGGLVVLVDENTGEVLYSFRTK